MPLIRKPAGAPPPPAPDAASVIAGLSSERADDRWSAARAAAALPELSGALASALRSERESRVREAGFMSLASITTAEAADHLISFLRSDDANQRASALDALRLMVGGMRDLLPRLLGDGDVDIRILSCELARALPGPDATTVLCNLLKTEPDVNVCAAAVDVLSEVGGPAALPVLAECERRFQSSPFLGFAIRIASDRIQSQHPAPRA